MSVDLVWIVGGPPDALDRDELRYSIRSATENLRVGYRDVVIVGDVPDWFVGVRIPLTPDPDKWRNQRQSIAAYVNLPSAADELILLNDDMYITEPADTVTPYRNKAPASTWNTDHGTHGWGCWTCAVKRCAAWVSADLGRDIWLYENHAPLRFDTDRLRDLVNRYPADLPLMVGEAFPLAGIGGEGVVAGNAKVKVADSLAEKLALPMPYLSGSPGSWNGSLGEWVRREFPTPCQWEREARVRAA